MAQDDKVFKNESYGETFLTELSSIWKEKIFCDVTIVVGDKELSCHKVVLAASIPYFRSMFMCNMMESSMQRIVLQELDPAYVFNLLFNMFNHYSLLAFRTVESIVQYGYSGKLLINNDNVVQLLHDSTFLLLTDVQNACCDFLTNRYVINI